MDSLSSSAPAPAREPKLKRPLKSATYRNFKSPATGPISVTADSRMSEDYVLSADILLNPQSARSIAAVQMPDGTWTALATIAGTGLTHVYRDANSQSGWNSTPVANGSAVVEVATGIDAIGTTHAFYQDGAFTYHMSLGADGSWSTPDRFEMSQNLGVAYVPLFGEVVGYGITVKGDLLMIRKGNGPAWEGTVCSMQGGLQGAQAVLSMTSAQAWTLGAAVSGRFELFTGTGSSLASGPQVVSTPNSIPRVHFAYTHLNSTMFMFSDDKNNLYTSVAFSDNIQLIPNSQVVQATGIVDSSHHVHFYAADRTGKMWILHQTGYDANNAPVWAHMFPLDVNAAEVVSPFQGMEGKVLFARGVDQTLHILTQDGVTQHWTRRKLQNPSASVPYRMTHYRTQLSASDQYSNPAPNATLTVTASAETDILVNGKSYLIGPGENATLTTDGTGVLTISTVASSLVSPQYTVTATNLAQPLTVRPDANYHAFLSGSSGINTGSAVIPPMSSTTLQNATVNGQPLAPNLSAKNAQTAAQGIVNGMKSVPGSSGSADPSLAAGWALDFRDAANGKMINFATSDELKAYVAGLSSNGAAALAAGTPTVGDIWNDIGQFFGDIWHAIESAAMAVVNWVVNVVESLINLVVKIGEDLIQLAALAIKTIEDAIPFIHAIFNFIGALVEKVLDWVKDLLGWNDIWNTKKTFENYVLRGIPSLQNFLQYSAPVKVNNFFTNLKSEVDAELAKVSASYQGKSIGSLGSSPQSVLTRATRFRATSQVSPSQSNWMVSKFKENVGSSVLGPLTSNPPQNIVDAFWNALSDPTVMSDLNAALADLGNFFKLAFTNPKQFQQQGVSDLIDGIRHLLDWALDFMDQIVDNMLQLFAASLTGLQEILTQSLGDIPIVSWLYTNVICPSDQQEPLTILHACCLILAFPVTLAYKLAHNMQPPFASGDAEAVDAAGVRARSGATGSGAPLQMGSPSTIQEVIMYLSLLQACADIASDASSTTETSNFFNLVTGWLDLAVNFVMQVLSWPGQIFSFNWDWSSFTEGQSLSRGAWLFGWVLVLCNGLMMTQPNPQGGEIIRDTQDGLISFVLFGALAFALGVAGASKSLSDPQPTNADDVAAAVFGPLGSLTQFLRFQPVIDASEGMSAILKLLVDGVGDIGAGAAQLNG
jgi:hypothetical protein